MYTYLDSDSMDLKLLYSWWFIDPAECHYTTQTSKFNNWFFFFNQALNVRLKKKAASNTNILMNKKFHVMRIVHVFVVKYLVN